jgi:integrase
MKKPKHFPFEHQAGGLVFRIYSAPQVRTKGNVTKKTYESFLVKYYEGPNLAQSRKKNWEEVETFIDEVVAAHRNKDPERLELTGLDRRIYLAAVEVLKSSNKAVDQAARDYVAATHLVSPYKLEIVPAAQLLADTLKRLEEVPLSTAIDFYLQHGKTMTAIKTVPEVIAELTENLSKDGCGDYHIRDLKTRLGRFAIAFRGNINEIKGREITGWLQNLQKMIWKNGQQVESDQEQFVSRRTRNNYRDAINELFAFAKKSGYVPKGLPTEAAETVRVKVVSGKNHIITPLEAKRALENLSPHLIPYTVLKLFSGLRTEEAFGLRWEDLRFGSKAVIIEAELAKLRQRRVPPILPNLARWLRPFRGLSGPINPKYSSPQAVHKAVAKESERAGVILRRNTFRNCYISYRVAQPNPPAIVAEEAGTSTRMVKSNYLELATKPEAKQWFSINPSKSKLGQLTEYANSLKSEKK